MIPKGFVEINKGKCKEGDFIVSNDGGYEGWASGLVGWNIPINFCHVYRRRRPLKNIEAKKTPLKKTSKVKAASRAHNTTNNAIALLKEATEHISTNNPDRWEYQWLQRAKAVIAQQH